MPSPRGFVAASVVEGKICVIGGHQFFGSTLSTVEEDEYSQIVNVREIPMPLLRRKVQYHVLTNLRKAIPRTWENQRLINEMFEKYRRGFVVHDSGKAKNRKSINTIKDEFAEGDNLTAEVR
jgi:hypothetical protein